MGVKSFELTEKDIALIDRLLTQEKIHLIECEKAATDDHVKRILDIKQREICLLQIKLGTFV